MHTISKTRNIILGVSLLFAASCQESHREADGTTTDSTEVKAAEPAVSLSAVGVSPEFPGAQLNLESVKASPQGADSVKVQFRFGVKNYSLKSQTGDQESKQCSNSAEGQHIHFILDNQPYKALYEPKNEITLARNTEHYLMAFLSRSYHESLKNKGAALVYHFRIDEKGNLQKMDVPETPMVFYSRPKGDYLGKDTENVLLDFYVWNGTLSQDGYRVKAEISTEGGRDTSFTLTEWKSYFLHGMPMGKSQLRLSLLDKDNNPVAGPETTAGGKIQLAEKEPMK